MKFLITLVALFLSQEDQSSTTNNGSNLNLNFFKQTGYDKYLENQITSISHKISQLLQKNSKEEKESNVELIQHELLTAGVLRRLLSLLMLILATPSLEISVHKLLDLIVTISINNSIALS